MKIKKNIITAQKYNCNQNSIEYFRRNNSLIDNSISSNPIHTNSFTNDNYNGYVNLMTTNDNSCIYELKYSNQKHELIIVITNNNSMNTEVIQLMTNNKNFPFGIISNGGSCQSCKRFTCKCKKEPVCCVEDYSFCPNKGQKGDTGSKGQYGLKGDIGSSGTKGDKGDVGNLGLKGDTGNSGLKGDKGNLGNDGTKGDTGSDGTKGDKGDAGSIGLKGNKGDAGSLGLKGDKGDAGSLGLKGDKGDIGSLGLKGDKGDIGSSGLKGDKGDIGSLGLKGDKGDIGSSGLKGDKGDLGSIGLKGDKGDTGVKGIEGKRGKCGIGFRYLSCYNPKKIYYYNDVVRVNNKCCGKIFIYTSKIPSGPYPLHTNIHDVPGWEFMLSDGSTTICQRCSTDDILSTSCLSNDINLYTTDNIIKNLKNNWNGNPSYKINDDTYGNNNIFITNDDNYDNHNELPIDNLILQNIITNCKSLYQGLWNQHKKYYINNIVKYNGISYICVKNVYMNVNIENTDFWVPLFDTQISEIKQNIIETYGLNNTQTNNKNNKFTYQLSDEFSPIDIGIPDTINYSQKFYSVSQDEILSSPCIKKTNKNPTKIFYYAYKFQNTYYTHIENNIQIPIVFDEIDYNSNFIDNDQGLLIFKETGKYMVNINIKYSGTDNVKVGAYLKHNDFIKKLKNASRTFNFLVDSKNVFQYSFIIDIEISMSLLEIILKFNLDRNPHEKFENILIFGDKKTWIYIEKLL
ncbi:collagen-like protein [Cotonvirus japonicus]|uniref:Collagen-like protein n=1 Tax=Cotonvirus japonicus TaxID=2811091 RepID=A0ABM7NT02_9VIRU|nr:collagen-like protein [Cotonvirus japonicus]BCS83269.1 collagen-like protein [Cotonvirus japonicus]